ncbi:putative DMBT1-like protein [Dicentrarchus labrax]|uniref:Deleted in malignant brain tumors 1 protein n=1 Tax=Dicentrarchus labrax TaxID=13489 RepID=A0A8C4DQZ1_DICLA|nr:putative DMBT1-like protein [Dicentrarchus labrax]
MGSTQQRNLCYLIIVSLLLTLSPPAADRQIRLTGPGSTRCSGRVEIYYNDTWGTICDDSWDLIDAKVLCKELGCGTALDPSHISEGTGQIWLDNVHCSGNEGSLSECQHGGFGINNCGHNEDAGVVCSGIPIRLSGSNLCSGRVEIYYNSAWGTVCEDNWDLNDAKVVCRELGCGAAQRAAQNMSSGKGSGQTWLNKVNCFGNERSLTQCRHGGFRTHDCTHSEGAGVVCLPNLPKPSISMNPAGKVTWGQDVDINCLISPPTQQRLSGTFILNQPSGSVREEQTSHHSATFRINKVDFVDMGSYQCQYQTQVSSQDFFSPLSASVRLSVAVPLWLLVSSVAAGILLLLLLVLVVVCLVLRRRRRSKQPGGVVQTQLTVRKNYEEEDEEEGNI